MRVIADAADLEPFEGGPHGPTVARKMARDVAYYHSSTGDSAVENESIMLCESQPGSSSEKPEVFVRSL